MRGLATAGMMLALGCSRLPQPSYASWDPVLEAIPRVDDRAEAKRRLAASRAIWHAWLASVPRFPANVSRNWLPIPPAPAYSYVRARQLAEQRVAFTLLDVAGDRVVLRAYLSADPARLSSVGRVRPEERDVRTLWVERRGDIGAHAEGAPAKTIDQLYAECAQLIDGAPVDALPRLYFHPNGILMQCGQAPSDCGDCESYSVQDVSRFSLSHEQPIDDAKLWTCATEAGLALPLGSVLHGAAGCFPAFQKDPTFAAQQARREAEAREAERCEQNLESDCPAVEEAGVDICQIDPAVCTVERPYRARWSMAMGGLCSEPQPAREPQPLEVGKSLPGASWRFPVVGTSCGLDRHFQGGSIYLYFEPKPDLSFAPRFGR